MTAKPERLSVPRITPRFEEIGAGDRPLELGRDLDLDLHDRLEQDRVGLAERLAEAVAGADLEGHVDESTSWYEPSWSIILTPITS